MKEFKGEQEDIVSKILWGVLKGQSQENALEIMRQCIYYIPIHPELYKEGEQKELQNE